jgi:hypothetical protein
MKQRRQSRRNPRNEASPTARGLSSTIEPSTTICTHHGASQLESITGSSPKGENLKNWSVAEKPCYGGESLCCRFSKQQQIAYSRVDLHTCGTLRWTRNLSRRPPKDARKSVLPLDLMDRNSLVNRNVK